MPSTTGFPKGATLSHHNVLNNGYSIGQLLRYTEHDRVCVPVPFYHCFGMVIGNLAATSHGTTVVIPAPSFEPKATLEAIQAERCTSLPAWRPWLSRRSWSAPACPAGQWTT